MIEFLSRYWDGSIMGDWGQLTVFKCGWKIKYGFEPGSKIPKTLQLVYKMFPRGEIAPEVS
jgi:hypothetical protein